MNYPYLIVQGGHVLREGGVQLALAHAARVQRVQQRLQLLRVRYTPPAVSKWANIYYYSYII